MKQELRCHTVLCPSENKARLMAKRLKERLHQALVDFKKEKVWRQNARLSLANAADEQKTMPFEDHGFLLICCVGQTWSALSCQTFSFL